MRHADTHHDPQRPRPRVERLPAQDGDGLLRPLLPADMPFVPGNQRLEDVDLDHGTHLTLLHHQGSLNGEDQYRYNLVHRDEHGHLSWLGGNNAPGDVPRFWSEDARLELSAEDVVNGLYHAGWEYQPFVDWLERLAALPKLGSSPHIARLIETGTRYARQARAFWPHLEDPTWIDQEVVTSYPGPVNGRGRESTLELQRMDLALRFGMPDGAFRREAHRWSVDWQQVPSAHPASRARRKLERMPASGPMRARIRPSLSLAGLYQAMPDRRALVETLAAGVKKGAGRPGANVGVMWKLATGALYASGDLPMLAAREALQNSRDSLRAAYRLRTLKPGQGRFEIRWDPSARQLVFDDNGLGMDVETILGPFLTLGESTKRGEGGVDAAGGFGIAKAVILGASSTFKWELHTRDNRAVSDGPDRDVEVFQTEARPGAQLTLNDVSGDQVWDYAHGRWRDVESRMKELLAACDLPDLQLSYNGELIPPFFSRRKGSPVEVQGSWGEGTVARVKAYRRSDKGGAYWIRLDGLAQFKQASVTGNLRADVVIDLTPTARPGTPGYPLNASRDQFVEPARSTFRAVVKEVEKESLSVGKKKEDEVFPLEEGTAEDAETREALDALTASLMDDPELAALLAPDAEAGEATPNRDADRAVETDFAPDGADSDMERDSGDIYQSDAGASTFASGDGALAGAEVGALLQRFLTGGDFDLTGAPTTDRDSSTIPSALIDLDPNATMPVWGANSELPGFPLELGTPALLHRLFQTMAVVGHRISENAQTAMSAALAGTLNGAGLLELASAASTALDVFTGRAQPDPAGAVPSEALQVTPLPVGDGGHPVFPDGFLSMDPTALRTRMLGADARGHHFPAPMWRAVRQAENAGTLNPQQQQMLRVAEEEATAVNTGTYTPTRIPLAPFGDEDPEAVPLPRHKQFISLEETGGHLPGLPPGLNTYDQVKTFLHEGLRRAPGAVPEDTVEQVLSAIATDPIHRSDLSALMQVVRDMVRALEPQGAAYLISSEASGTPATPRAHVNAGVPKRPSGTNPFGAVAAVRIAASYPKDRARAFKRNPTKWLPYLALWTLALKLVTREAKIARRYKPGFLLDDDTVGLASKQEGDKYALILVNAGRIEESVKTNRERPLSIAAFVHGVAVHELAHLDGKMGDGHDEEYVAKREDLGTETAHLLPVLTKAAVKLLKLPEPKDPIQARLLKLERDLQRAKEGRETARVDRAKAVRELEKSLRDCRKVLSQQGAPESVRTGQACDAAGPSSIPARITIEPKQGSLGSTRGTFSEYELRAIRTATQSFEGARDRWKFLIAMGATDEELEQMLRYELGSQGGSSEPGGLWIEFSGPGLSVTLKNGHGDSGTTIKGRRLLLATRRLYGIEDYGEVDPRIRRVLYALIEKLRSALPSTVPAGYLYSFFARHRQTLIDALARRFGSSDPALLPAKLDRPPQSAIESLPSWTSAGREDARLDSRRPADRARFTAPSRHESLPRWTPTPFSRPGPGQRMRPLEEGEEIPGTDGLRIGDPVRFRRAHRCPVWHITVPAGTLGSLEGASLDQVAVLLEAPIHNPDPEDLKGWIETIHVPLSVVQDVLEVH